MTLSAISNTVLAKSDTSHQKTGTDIKQSENGRLNPSSTNNLSGNKFDENITLSQPEKTNVSSKVIDEKAAEKLLHQSMKSILGNSKTSVSAQARTIPEAAHEFLT